jgi:hypothetical protein
VKKSTVCAEATGKKRRVAAMRGPQRFHSWGITFRRTLCEAAIVPPVEGEIWKFLVHRAVRTDRHDDRLGT